VVFTDASFPRIFSWRFTYFLHRKIILWLIINDLTLEKIRKKTFVITTIKADRRGFSEKRGGQLLSKNVLPRQMERLRKGKIRGVRWVFYGNIVSSEGTKNGQAASVKRQYIFTPHGLRF
jgi:hypothetical protein